MESNTSAEIDSTSAELDSTSSTISDVSGGKVETIFSSYVEGLSDVPHVVHRRRGEKLFFSTNSTTTNATRSLALENLLIIACQTNCSSYLWDVTPRSHLTKRREDIDTTA